MTAAIGACRPDDAFIATVLEGALIVGQHAADPVRGNLFAAAVRERATRDPVRLVVTSDLVDSSE